MKTTNIPFGWRNLIDGDCQQDTDWFFNSSGEWQKNPESDNGLPFDVLSSYTMIRRTKINVSPNPNVSYILPNQDNTTLDRMAKDCIALKATHQSEIAELKKQIAHLTKERNKLRDEKAQFVNSIRNYTK